MRIGILSDTHDQIARASRAVRQLIAEGAEALIHCGDFTSPAAVSACVGLPGYYVFGNNDFDEDGLRQAMVDIGGVCLDRGGEVELAGRRIAVTHGDSIRQVRHLGSRCPDYLFFGHSHVTHDRREGPTRWINPGALHRAPEWTVALLDLERDLLQFVKIC